MPASWPRDQHDGSRDEHDDAAGGLVGEQTLRRLHDRAGHESLRLAPRVLDGHPSGHGHWLYPRGPVRGAVRGPFHMPFTSASGGPALVASGIRQIVEPLVTSGARRRNVAFVRSGNRQADPPDSTTAGGERATDLARAAHPVRRHAGGGRRGHPGQRRLVGGGHDGGDQPRSSGAPRAAGAGRPVVDAARRSAPPRARGLGRARWRRAVGQARRPRSVAGVVGTASATRSSGRAAA